MTNREKYNVAQLTVQLLEQRVSQIVAERRNKLSKVVNVESRNQLFWYGSDDVGNIAIMQDASFVCTGVHVIGQYLSGLRFYISIENLWLPRQATQSSAIPTQLAQTNSNVTQQSISIPVDHFLPAWPDGDGGLPYPNNVDYWYTPTAGWLINRGDTVRCLFKDDAASTIPRVVLSGYKVL